MRCAGGQGRCDVRGARMRVVLSPPLATTDAQGEVERGVRERRGRRVDVPGRGRSKGNGATFRRLVGTEACHDLAMPWNASMRLRRVRMDERFGAHARLGPSVGWTSPLTSPYPIAAEASPVPSSPPISFLCASCAIFLDAFLRVRPSGFRPTKPGRAPFQVFSIVLRFRTRFFVPIDLVSIGPFVPSRR